MLLGIVRDLGVTPTSHLLERLGGRPIGVEQVRQFLFLLHFDPIEHVQCFTRQFSILLNFVDDSIQVRCEHFEPVLGPRIQPETPADKRLSIELSGTPVEAIHLVVVLRKLCLKVVEFLTQTLNLFFEFLESAFVIGVRIHVVNFYVSHEFGQILLPRRCFCVWVIGIGSAESINETLLGSLSIRV